MKKNIQVFMYTDNTPISWGKYKFTALRRIPAKWLLGKHKSTGIHDQELVQWVADNFDRLKEREEIEKSAGFPEQITNPCTKYQYSSQEQAEKHLRQIISKGQQYNNHVLPSRAYKCDKCPFYHLTSKI